MIARPAHSVRIRPSFRWRDRAGSICRRLPERAWPLKQSADLQPASANELNDCILRIAANGDRMAFEQLFRQVAPRVKAYLKKRGTEDGIAEEIAQETMLTVWRKADLFDPARAGASTWIFTIARNLNTDYARRTNRAFAGLDDTSQTSDDSPDADMLIAAAERDTRVREVVGQLPSEQAEIIKMSFFSDKPHGEIARLLDLPLGTVKSRIRLAIVRLRTGLEGTEA
jgi:RNA polymerase sigma-70 factor (ECF subfamily)